MQNKALKYLLLALMVAIIVPQIAMASWWNPFSWGIWNRVFHFKQTEQKQEQIIKQDDKKEQPVVNENQQNSGEQVVCTMDAKECPDGSYVGREGPKCEFKACPEVKVETPVAKTADWKTYTNDEYGFEIKYPQNAFVSENPDEYNESIKVRVMMNNNGLGDTGSVTVYTYSDKSAMECKNSSNSSLVKINGITFDMGTFPDSAMGGQRGIVSRYYVFYNNVCYSIESLVGWHSIQFTHDATDLKSATQQELAQENKIIEERKAFVNSIVSTFKFIK